MSMAKDDLDREERTAPRLDADGVAWTATPCEESGDCAHCDERIVLDEAALQSDSGEWMHVGCWDGHVGFAAAMAKDD